MNVLNLWIKKFNYENLIIFEMAKILEVRRLLKSQSVVHNRRRVRLVGAQLYPRVACPVDMMHSYSHAQSVRAQLVVLNRYRAQSYGAQSIPSQKNYKKRQRQPYTIWFRCDKQIVQAEKKLTMIRLMPSEIWLKY